MVLTSHAAFVTLAHAQTTIAPINVRSLPIGAWLEAGESAEIPWRVTLRPATLRMDQRLEVIYEIRISAKDLNNTGNSHQLVFLSRISSPDGEWLNEPGVIHHSVEDALPKNVETVFGMRVSVKPGDFFLWLILYDNVTGKHNVAKRRLRIPEIKNDPLPNSYDRLPYAEFPESQSTANVISYSDKLLLPFPLRDSLLPIGLLPL